MKKSKSIKIYLRREDWTQSICVHSIKQAQNEIRRWLDQTPLVIKSKDKRARTELDLFQMFLLQGVK